MKNKNLLKELREKDMKDLSKMVNEKKAEVRNIATKIKMGKEHNLKRAKNIKKEIAQILTIISQKGVEK